MSQPTTPALIDNESQSALPSSRSRPPLHQVHGDNIVISNNCQSARCLRNYGKGFIFGAQPIKISQKINVRISQLAEQFAGICFGFTSRNPDHLINTDIPYSYLEFNMTPGYWLWPLFKHFCRQGAELFYYVTRSGEVHFGVDGQEIDVFYKKIDTRGPLWALLEISGQSTEIQVSTGAQFIETPLGSSSSDDDEDKENVDSDDYKPRRCLICCEHSINAVLYVCGHMVMCYKCAKEQWKGAGLGNCPVCRIVIKDVIRIYK